jgi:MFS family permease
VPDSAVVEVDVARVHRRTLGVLVAGQVLGGLGFGATLTMGSLLFEELAGAQFSGLASTMSTLGAAVIAIPLARLAARRGRRISLGTGAMLAAIGAIITVSAAATQVLPLLFVGIALIGMGNAANLQARFAATDLAPPQHRGRDLSIVVWTTTVGAVIGPLLLTPGEELGRQVGLPAFTGPFVLTTITQVVALIVYLVGLRPDPLLLAAKLRAQRLLADAASANRLSVGGLPRRFYIFAVLSVSLSHAVMVSVMAMTPVHITSHGGNLTVVGITISLHVLGMFALSPLFGVMADRLGRVPSILVGQLLLAAGLMATGFGAENSTAVTVGLVLIGLGWSASTIAGSALVTESTPAVVRTRNQGRNDLVMSLSGAAGGALAGPVVTMFGFSGLSAAAGLLVVTVIGGSVLLGVRGRR